MDRKNRIAISDPAAFTALVVAQAALKASRLRGGRLIGFRPEAGYAELANARVATRRSNCIVT